MGLGMELHWSLCFTVLSRPEILFVERMARELV